MEVAVSHFLMFMMSSSVNSTVLPMFFHPEKKWATSCAIVRFRSFLRLRMASTVEIIAQAIPMMPTASVGQSKK